ncbi:unnamed protein product [Anisakis simplex]|uniref:NUCB1-like N-terminal domain-containing protein n=1 Tax=Anisakis simplex TaxID=6269 RepID=A0A3P6RRL5_ANISI|nr:unnamed protein product [Anisakis simplex]
MYKFAYTEYLKQVVQVLENDTNFTQRIKGMAESDIKSGKIADHLDELSAHTFRELHKLKAAEIERLRKLIDEQVKRDGGYHNIKAPEHIDVDDFMNFGKEDLRKLIVKTVADMEEQDRQRREEFKNYEMKKKAEIDHKMVNMSPEERQKYQNELDAQKKRHNEHEKVKHPGSRDQLEQVWEDTDQLEKDNYDPRTFFALHDLNGDGFWSTDELDTLFESELQKLYNETDPDDDQLEKIEEMYRMRDHVLEQMDKNKDRMISIEEFLADSEAQTPNKDEGWKDIGDETVYTDEELKKFEQEYARQQGWGDYAYSTLGTTRQPLNAHQQQQMNNIEQPAQRQQQPQQRQQHQQVPVGGVQQVQLNVGGQQGGHQQQAANIPIGSDNVDKTYGV